MSDLHSTHYVNTLIANKSVNDHFTSSSCAEIPHLETAGCSLGIGNRRILCLAFSCMTIIFYSDMEPFSEYSKPFSCY